MPQQQETPSRMIADNRFALPFASGALLWSFVLLIPTLHLDLPWSPALLLLLFAPIAVLLLAVFLDSRDACVAAFLPTLLPPMLLHPELAGPRVYGAGAISAVILATAIHVIVSWREQRFNTIRCKPQSQPGDRGARVLHTHALVFCVLFFGMAYLAYFHRPFREILARNYGENYSQATIVIGSLMFVAWLAVTGSALIANFGQWILSPQLRTSEWLRFEVECTEITRVRLAMGWSLLIATLSGVIFWGLMWLGN